MGRLTDDGTEFIQYSTSKVAFKGTELRFAIRSWTNDNWQVGFCRPGELEAWWMR
jgi:hypothetical protein